MGTLRGDVMLSASRKYFRLHSSQKPLKWKTGWIGKRGPFFPPHTTLAQSPCVHDTKKRTKGGKVRRSVPDLFSENHSGKTRRKPKEGEVGCGMGRWQQIGVAFWVERRRSQKIRWLLCFALFPRTSVCFSSPSINFSFSPITLPSRDALTSNSHVCSEEIVDISSRCVLRF